MYTWLLVWLNINNRLYTAHCIPVRGQEVPASQGGGRSVVGVQARGEAAIFPKIICRYSYIILNKVSDIYTCTSNLCPYMQV